MWFWMITSVLIFFQALKIQRFSFQTATFADVTSFLLIAILVFIVHVFSFFKGQRRGYEFLKNDELSQLVGLKNEWEQSEIDKEEDSRKA